MRNIFIPVCDNGMGLVRAAYAQSMLTLGLSKVLRDCNVTSQRFTNPSPTMCGNAFSNEFIRGSFTHLLLIDTDIIFSPQHIEWLFEDDQEFVAGLYPQGVPGLVFPIEFLTPANEFAKHPLDRGGPALIEVKRIARGFTLYKRSVFEKLIESGITTYHDALYKREHHLFWDDLPGGHSEDFRFCDKWRAIGGKVFVDQRCLVQHEKSAVYPIKGTYQETDVTQK